MIVAYLINQYPQLSHSFIRREINAHESHGNTVVRISIRPSGRQIDPGDQREADRTHVLLSKKYELLIALLIQFLTRPLPSFRALWQTCLFARAGGGWIRHFAYFVEACAVTRLCRINKASHLHAHFGTNPATVACLAHLCGGPPYSFTVHGPEEFDRPATLSLSTKIEQSSFVAGVSSFGRSQLYRQVSLKHWEKICVVRCGLADDFFKAESYPVPADPRLVCVGRLCEQKGALLLVRAAAIVRQHGQSFELILVGDGPMRIEIEQEIDRLELREFVKLLGAQPGDRVRMEIQRSRAMVLPSFAEGLPVVLMESLAVGRPVVSTFIAGIPELVTSECGWLVPAGDVDALARAMSAVLTASTEQLNAMGRVGSLRVAERHNARIEAATLMEHFRNSARKS